MPDPDIYGEALAYLSLFRKDEESPERYALQEYLISMTDNCLRLLTDAVCPIYSPDEMNTSLRHSILHFASGIRDNGIFPYKAERIISIIRDYAGNISRFYSLISVIGGIIDCALEFSTDSDTIGKCAPFLKWRLTVLRSICEEIAGRREDQEMNRMLSEATGRIRAFASWRCEAAPHTP